MMFIMIVNGEIVNKTDNEEIANFWLEMVGITKNNIIIITKNNIIIGCETYGNNRNYKKTNIRARN